MTTTLIIDDDTALLEAIARTADAANLDLVTASTWERGFALFQALAPDLVIADYNLPDSKHGLQLLTEISELRPSVRLILMSGYLDDSDREQINALGTVHRTLIKTVDPIPGILLEEIERASAERDVPTDWKGYADAYLTADAAPKSELDDLDSELKQKLE